MTFTFPHDPHGDHITHFKNTQLTINTGITILVGCNGSGKTTLLRLIKKECEQNEIPYLSFDNKIEGGAHAMSQAEFYGNIDSLLRLAWHSEGEQINECLGQMAIKLSNKVKSMHSGDTLFVLLDACDSGYSIDNLLGMKDFLHIVRDDTAQKGINAYIIVSTNSYELVRDETALNVSTFTTRKFKSYEAYYNFILKSRKYKDSRYAK